MAYDPDRDFSLDYPEEEGEGDAWNELSGEDFSLFATDPGTGLDDAGAAQ